MYVLMYIILSSFGSPSFIGVAMNIRDQYEIIGLRKISHSITQPCSSTCLKKKALRNELKQCCALTKQSEKSNIFIHSKLLKF